jgi:hypothetical protein
MANIVSSKVYDNAIIQDGSGKIVWNCAQMDSPVIRRKYDNGTVDVIAQKTGEVVLPPFSPEEPTLPVCQHCGERPW